MTHTINDSHNHTLIIMLKLIKKVSNNHFYLRNYKSVSEYLILITGVRVGYGQIFHEQATLISRAIRECKSSWQVKYLPYHRLILV